jgi:structural maintenance of chromosome 4
MRRLKQLQATVLPPLQREHDALMAAAAPIDAAIRALQARIQEIGGVRLRAAKARVDGLNESMQTKGQQLTQAQVLLKTATKVRLLNARAGVLPSLRAHGGWLHMQAVAKAEEAVAALVTEVDGLVAQSAQLQAEVDEKAATAAAVEASYTKTEKVGGSGVCAHAPSAQLMRGLGGGRWRQLLTDKAEELETTKRVYEESKARLAAVRSAEVEAAAAADDAAKTADDLGRRVEQGRRQLEALRVQPIPYVVGSCAGTRRGLPLILAAMAASLSVCARLETEEPAPIPTLTEAEATAVDMVALTNAITVLDGPSLQSRSVHTDVANKARFGESVRNIDQLKNSKPTLSVIQQYAAMERDYTARAAELAAATAARDGARAEFDGLRKRRLDAFMAGFTTITLKLKEMYQMVRTTPPPPRQSAVSLTQTLCTVRVVGRMRYRA